MNNPPNRNLAQSNYALVLHGANDLRLVSPFPTISSGSQPHDWVQEEREIPHPAQGEALVAIQATGLCGSDLHYYTHGRNGNFVLKAPLVLGHEASGTVSALPTTPAPNGTDSSTATALSSPLKIGDRVALEVGLPCRSCPLCLAGRYNLCPTLTFKSSAKTYPHADGTLQTFITHPSSLCHKLPDTVTFEQGALVEPLSVCLHAINRAQTGGSGPNSPPIAGSSVLVLGAGAVGMLTAAALSVMGATKIVIADIDGGRLKIAHAIGGGRFGIIPYLLPRNPPPPSAEESIEVASALATTVLGAVSAEAGFTRIFECTGFPSVVQLGIFCAAPGGKLVLVGMGHPIQTLPLGAAVLREVDLIGTFRYANCYPAAIELFASGKLAGVAESLVTHRVSMAENGSGETAFGLAAGRKEVVERDGGGRVPVKVLLVP